MTDRGDELADEDPPSDDLTNERIARVRAVYNRYLGDRNRLAVALVAIVAVGLAFRLFFLTARVAHYDEGRVAYWSLHHARTDSFVYRFIIHGPVVQHLHRWLFPLVGANDFSMRLPVALIGGALPGSVWLFREHLRDSELVGAALLLALNPLLLYYSRFMRSDLLVATFMFVALGMFVRFYDTRRARYLYGVAAFVALGFGSKENAVVYLLTWGGATALLAEHALFRPRSYDSGFALVAAKVRAILDRGYRSILWIVARYTGHLVGAVFVAGFLVLFIYAPRGDVGELVPHMVPGTANYVGFWEGIVNPAKWGQLVDATFHGFSVEHTARTYPQTFDGIFGGLEYWFGTDGPSCSETAFAGMDVTGLFGALGIEIGAITGYPCTLGKFLKVLLTVALPLFSLAILGTLVERYARPVSRNVVMFSAYIGFVSLIGYPLGTDIFGAWILVHVLVPLSLPAGVALVKLYRWGRVVFADEDGLNIAIAAYVAVVTYLFTGAFLSEWQLILVLLPLSILAGFTLPSLYSRSRAEFGKGVTLTSTITGMVVLLVYPLAADVLNGWIALVLLPVLILGGVGLTTLYRWARAEFGERETLRTAISALFILLILGQMVFVGVGTVYTNSTAGDNVMVQYAQPSNDLKEPLADLERIAASHEGSPDLVVFGDELVDDSKAVLDTQPHCIKWYNPMLPLPWYLYSDDVSVTCERGAENLTERVETNPPPVILVADKETDVPREVLEAQYVRKSAEIRRGSRERVFWIHEDWLN